MNERGRNESDISRYTDVEYSPEGYKTVYRWGDFLEIAGGHVYNAMDTIDLVSTGGEYEGFNPRYAYTCEFVGCSTLVDGIALFRPVSRDGEDLTQIAFLRSDIDDDTGAYTECFEAGSFDIAAASDIQCSDLGIDLLDYFRGRSFEGLSGVKRGLNGREAVGAVEVATGCDLDLFEDFWLGSPGETDVHVGPYVKRDLIALSYIVNDFSQMYGTTARDIRKLLARVNNFHPDRLAAVKAYLDCEYVTDRDTSDEKTYRWSDFLEIAGGDARYASMLIERTAPGEPQEGLHPETLVDQDIRDGEAFMLAGRPIAPEDIYDLPGTVHGLYSELVDNVGRSGTLARDWRGFSAGTDADDVLREIDGAFGETEYSRAPWCASIPGRRSNRHSRRAARSASRPEACAHRPARASSVAGCTSITATSRNRRRSFSGSAIRKPVPSSAWKPARPSWAIRPRPVPCMYRPPRSARPSATDRP